MIPLRHLFALLVLGSALGLLTQCGQTQSRGGETHFLKDCNSDSECGELSCLCGVCSVPCANTADCGPQGKSAVCEQLECGSSGVCEVLCEDSSDCSELEKKFEFECQNGRCRQEKETPETPSSGPSMSQGGQSTASGGGASRATGGAVSGGGATGTGGTGDTDPIVPNCTDGRVGHPSGTYSIYAGQPLDVEAFCLDPYEVTVEDYQECVIDGDCAEPVASSTFHTGSPSQPVNWVNLAEASAYCAWAGGRIPTRSELTWAARGEDSAHLYTWGDEAPLSSDEPPKTCWEQTAPCATGSYELDQTARGVFDLAGNVQEWATQPGACLFGGSYDVEEDNFPHLLLATTCRSYAADFRYPSIGFRCSKSD